MNISKSKKQLAKIISENGGWRDGAKFSAQDQDGDVFFYTAKPTRSGGWWLHDGGLCGVCIVCDEVLPNWHQTVLDRDEYFHLYPAPDVDGWIKWEGGDSPVDGQVMIDVKFRYGACATSGADCFNFTHDDHKASDIIAYRLHKPENNDLTQVGDTDVVESKPTIEQLAAEYRNRKDYAERKREEADAAKDDADAKLKALELACEALGFLVSPITAKQEAELVIEFKVGDEVECVESNIKRDKYNGMVGRLRLIDESDTSTPYLVDFGGNAKIWCHEVKFIRRP